MEIDELKNMWQQYDQKLQNLERINKKLILDTLSKKPKRRINWMQGKTLYALIITPLVFMLVIPRFLKMGNIDWLMVVGGILSLFVLIILMYFYLKGFIALLRIKVNQDSIVESALKVSRYKSIINTRQKYLWFSYPILFFGIILIERKTLNFDTAGIIFMVAILLFIFAAGYGRFKYQQNEIDDLEKEIIEIKELIQ